MLELLDPAGLLGDGPRALPALATLLLPVGPDAPPVRIQLLLAGAPAPAPGSAGSTVATSYRQLTEGRVPAQERAVLAIRVQRRDGWTEGDLHRALSSAVRKVTRRVAPWEARLLGAEAVLRVLRDMAHHDPRRPVRESWSTVHVGGLLQSTFRLPRWPDGPPEVVRHLLPQLFALPAAAVTVSLCVGPRGDAPALVPADLSIRLAADTPGNLAVATRALGRLLGGLGCAVQRLDGRHLPGLAATLPLAWADGAPPVPPAELDSLELPYGAAGLMIGANRHGRPVTLRLFRPEATRVVLAGGVRAAQLVAVRALALGARVVVQTARPRSWERFVRGVGVPGGSIVTVPAGGALDLPGGSPLRPVLLVVDVGAVGADSAPGQGWQASLVVRDELTSADGDLLARADLAILQPLDAAEATLAGTALGLGTAAARWLTQARHEMVAVVNRRALRWVLLAPTAIEVQLIGSPARRGPRPGVLGAWAGGPGVTRSRP